IFASLGPSGEDANLLVPREVQQMLVESQPPAFERIDNAWGARGWTRMRLRHVGEATCLEVLREAPALATPAPKAKRAGARTNASSAGAKTAKRPGKGKVRATTKRGR